jgi:hypothetical protein
MQPQKFHHSMGTVITIVLLLALAAGPLYGQATEQSPPPTPDQEQPEVLTRGPVHEAFAEPVNLQVQAALMAPTQPPPAIVEIPPAQSPQGGQFVWVPGYWSWDAERKTYIWISACWRAAPPNTYWVPGYWARAEEGWEWVAGFWSPTGTQEIEYLPAPPALQDLQPPSPPPSPNTLWVPPCWYWNQNQYIQRPGYWLAAQSDWVWVPAHYVWTPRGYIFVAGIWDYTLERRGVLFAPVYFPPNVYAQAGFSYSPSIVIDVGMLQVSLFTNPRYSHYYFGDYYDDDYLHVGIYPWFESERHDLWYDPIYQHDRWHYSQSEPRWEERERHEYDLRLANRDLRPARTYHEMEVRLAKLPEPQQKTVRMAQPLTAFVADKTTSMKFIPSNAESQRAIVTQATAVRKFGDERSRWESPATGPKTAQSTVERKTPVAPPIARKEPATSNLERKAPAVPPADRKEPVTSTPERKTPVVPPAERKEPATQPVQAKAPFVPPRQVHVTQPERVKVPVPPIVAKERPAEKDPPPRPVNERKDKVEVKDAPTRGEVKDAPKGEDKQKKNRSD